MKSVSLWIIKNQRKQEWDSFSRGIDVLGHCSKLNKECNYLFQPLWCNKNYDGFTHYNIGIHGRTLMNSWVGWKKLQWWKLSFERIQHHVVSNWGSDTWTRRSTWAKIFKLSFISTQKFSPGLILDLQKSKSRSGPIRWK